ncbi:MAG: cyanophycinase [Bacteroidota bacterium]|nr:cyanophycinase [Candidatus Kapabacteria bacterium]MDW8220408.1 cyanophycinase [Bacteroidota bacterium]
MNILHTLSTHWKHLRGEDSEDSPTTLTPSEQRDTPTHRTESSPNKGTIVIIGGNEDKLGEKAILRYVAEHAHAQCISVIPTASSYGKELGDEYAEIFLQCGIPKAHVIAARYVGDPDAPEYQAMLRESDAFFFTGGDQVRLLEVFRNTEALRIITQKHAQGALIAGTSAGAAAVSDVMLYDGDDEGLKKGTVCTAEGFGFLPCITVDTHFLQRNRLPRLAQILARGVNRYAIGVDEDTALVIHSHGHALVIGSEFVTFMAASFTMTSTYNSVQDNAPFSIHGISLSFLAPGAQFHLPSWTILES